MKTLMILGLMLFAGVSSVAADDEAVVQPKLFDDQNGNGISDDQEKVVANTDPNLQSEESVDAVQPSDDGGEGEPPSGE